MSLIPAIDISMIPLSVVSGVSCNHTDNDTDGRKCHIWTRRLPYAERCDHAGLTSRRNLYRKPCTSMGSALCVWLHELARCTNLYSSYDTVNTCVYQGPSYEALCSAKTQIQILPTPGNQSSTTLYFFHIFQNKVQSPICNLYLRYKTLT